MRLDHVLQLGGRYLQRVILDQLFQTIYREDATIGIKVADVAPARGIGERQSGRREAG
jgi:hypothetical protein